MIHTLRYNLANALALAAWAIAPRTGIASTYDLPSVRLIRRTRSHIQWTTTLRTTIRSFLFNNALINIVVSADTAWSKWYAVTVRAARKLGAYLTNKWPRGPTISQICRQWPKAF